MNVSTTLNVTGAIVTKTGVTLYTEEGDARALSQENFRTQEILETVLPLLVADGRAVIELEEWSIAKAIAAATNGAVQVEEVAGVVTSISAGGHTIEDPNGSLSGVIEDLMEGASAKGLTLFIENFSSIPRQHSKDELLEFMKRNDLPIADDGTIIVYKVLRHKDIESDHFVDCHSRTVPQRVGSIVQMPTSRVDPDRSRECSHGFHVCSRGYIGNFSGDTVVICKVFPQDVIAVPRDYNGSKMRVSQYQIVAEVPKNLQGFLQSNAPMNADSEGAKFVGRIVAGHHTPALELVEEIEHGKVNVTPIERIREPAVKKEKKAKSKPVFAREQKEKQKAKAISPKEVRAKIKALKNKAPTPKLTKEQKDFNKKLDKALKLFDKGDLSVREISRRLDIPRTTLRRYLDAAGR
jgi:hypothetical protein